MRFIRRVDGKLRATIRIEYAVGLDEFATAICYHASGELNYDGKPEDVWAIPIKKTQRHLVHLYKQAIKDGERYYYWADDVPPETSEALWDRAKGIVLEVFPFLAQPPSE